MFVMAQEPIPNMSASEVRTYFADKKTEKDLADAFAVVSNKFWWVEDNEYDYEEGTPEYKMACAITDEWGTLMDEYKKKNFRNINKRRCIHSLKRSNKSIKTFYGSVWIY